MSSRQLISPSRSGSSLEKTDFQLQPPPHRYKENRRCRVLSKRDNNDSLLQASLVRIKSPISPKKRTGSLISMPLIEEAAQSAGFDEESTDKLTSDHYYEQGSSDDDNHGGLITSPVRGEIRNSAFFGETCVWSPQAMTGFESSMDKCMSASRTSSFHSIARTVTTFGAVRKRGSSLQSIKSPADRKTAESSSSSTKAHTALPMSPVSPQKTIPSLDTPAELHFDRINTHLVLPLCDQEYEPLSATLKRIGAARKSIDVGEEEEFTPDQASSSHSIMASWEQRVSSQKQALEVNKANQEALQQAEGLFESSVEAYTKSEDKDSRYSWLDRDPMPTLTAKRDYNRIQSTPRGGPRKNLRSSVNSISTVLANHIFKRGQDRREGEDNPALPLMPIGEDRLSRPDSVAHREKAKGDGWGGLRPRSSWFPDLTFGPLISPPLSSSRHLRPLKLLQRSQTGTRDEWVDEVYTMNEEDKSLHCATEEQDTSLQKLRVHFPSYMPKPSRDRPLSEASENDSIIVKYTGTSVEGRPARRLMRSLRYNGGIIVALILVLGMAAFFAVIATQALKHSSHLNYPDERTNMTSPS